MALLNHQGGMDATNMIEWKRSWMVGRYAGESDLLLTHILPFVVRLRVDPEHVYRVMEIDSKPLKNHAIFDVMDHMYFIWVYHW